MALYKAINSELEKALLEIEVVESKTPSKPTFNQTLEGALRAQEQLSALANSLKQSLEEMHRLYSQDPALTEAVKRIGVISSANTISPDLQKTLEQFSQLYTPSPAQLELKEQVRNMAKLKIDIPPVIQKLHEIVQNLTVPKIDIPPELLSSLESLYLPNETTFEDKDKKEELPNQDNDKGGNN